ncbi:MAG: hypothetical protein WA755_12920 [Candidatus Acidiferrales bacterium]
MPGQVGYRVIAAEKFPRTDAFAWKVIEVVSDESLRNFNLGNEPR